MRQLGLLLVCLLLVGCEQRQDLAPVVELNWRASSHAKTHVVQPGETLYAISFRYDLDYRQLAAINQLQSPYTLRIGQVLHLLSGYNVTRYPATSKLRRPVYASRVYSRKSAPVVTSLPETPRVKMKFAPWQWPVYGRIAANFAPQLGKKGIDIAGVRGERIHAAASGVVAYAGSGLPGYGNLIIIKHDKQFLTAYGNNSRNLVRVGQHIRAGENIAEMGVVDRHYWGVHFEIRKAGKPVNPLYFLPKS